MMADSFNINKETIRTILHEDLVPLRHGGTLNSRRDANPLMSLVEEEKRWEAPEHPQGVLPQNWDGIEQNRTVTCMVLKVKANDRRKNLALRRNKFR
ncbi:uncharacterized protein TNCV_3083291 [Trichonephila clavipes]|nr:uncharacterized protein TNCV_3083291 [Trichonephila clavipes]